MTFYGCIYVERKVPHVCKYYIERLPVQLTTFVFPLKLTVRKEIVTKALS